MLKAPRRNFGIIPSNGMIAHLAILAGFILTPLALIVTSFIKGDSPGFGSGILSGAGLSILAGYAGYVLAHNGKELWAESLKMRYVQRILIPFLNKKYALTLVNSQDNARRVIAGTPVLFAKSSRRPTEAFLMGWDEIEKTSMGPHDALSTGKDFGRHICLVQNAGPDVVRELAMPGVDDDDREVFMNTVLPSLEETERGIKAMMANVIQGLPHGTTRLVAHAPSRDGTSGVTCEFSIRKGDDETMYPSQGFSAFVDAVLFNVRMLGSSLVVAVIKTDSGVTYMCGHLVQNSGCVEIDPRTMEEISGAATEGVVFVKNTAEIKEGHDIV